MFLAELFEVKTRDISLLSTDELTDLIISMCQEMDWQFDIDPLNEAVFNNGLTKLKKVETYLAELFLRNKMAAVNLWESQCPFAVPGMVPSFFRSTKK